MTVSEEFFLPSTIASDAEAAKYKALVDKLKQLEAERDHWKANHDTRVEAARLLIERPDMPLERVKAYQQHLAITAQNAAMREALYKLACLGNGDQFGNSIGNSIAQDALNLPNLAAEVLKRRDAKVLREAADRFEAVDPHPKHWDWLRRMANEIDGKEAT